MTSTPAGSGGRSPRRTTSGSRCLTLNTNQLHFNVPYAERTRFGQPLVNSAFTLALVTGMTVPDTSENATANLAWTDISMPNPVFVGDTLWAESEIVETRESRSTPTVGIVSMRCRGINQRREVVIEFRRTFMLYKRRRARGRERVPGHGDSLECLSSGRRPHERIAAFTSSLAFEQIPDEVIEATKLHVLDVLGCGLAAHGLGVAGEGRATMAELGTGDATAIGLDTPLPAPHAAFANAMLCHGLDYDDTHSDSVCHITVVVVPAALAVAESLGRSGEDVLAAVTAGTEVVSRIGMAASGAFHARGFHPTSVCGVFGATAAAARLAGLDAETTTSALGLAGSMSSGLMAYLNDGTPTKPVHAGWAAQAGVLAAQLAAHGAAGPAGVLDGRFGIFHAFVDDDEPSPRRAARRPRQPLGDAPRLVQAVSGVSLHARLPGCDRVPARRRGGRARSTR